MPKICAYLRCEEPQDPANPLYLCTAHYQQAYDEVLSKRSKMNPRLLGATATSPLPDADDDLTITCKRGHTYKEDSLHAAANSQCKACVRTVAKLGNMGVDDPGIIQHLSDLIYEVIARGWQQPMRHPVIREWLKKDITKVKPPQVSDLDTQVCKRGHEFKEGDATGDQEKGRACRCKACKLAEGRAYRRKITDEGWITLTADEIYQELLAETRKETKCAA